MGYRKLPRRMFEAIVRKVQPIPIVPLTRADFAKVQKQTADRLREGLNAQHPLSNPLLHDHFTNLGVISHIITKPPNGTPPPSAEELRKLHRTELCSVANPMTVYTRLKTSGELKTDSCMAILSNPNLTAYTDIELIASENNIPASYVVAKLMKLSTRPHPDISKWIRRVPPVPSIYRECIRIANQPKPKRNLEATDPRVPLKQSRMDLAAHMSYVLDTMGWETGFRRWVSWTRKGTPNKLTFELRRSLLKIPSLQLLRLALEIEDPTSEIVEQVGILLDWDESIVNVPFNNEFREQVVSFLLDALQKPESSVATAERVLKVLDIIRNSLAPERYLFAMYLAVQKWMDASDEERLMDVEWANSFVARTKEDLYPSINLSQRGQLDRLVGRLEDMGLEEARDSRPSIALEDVVLATVGLNRTIEQAERSANAL